MKSKILIYVCDDVEEPIYIVESDIQFDSSITIIVNSSDDLNKVIKNKSAIITKYKQYVNNYDSLLDEENAELIERLNSVKNYNDLMKSVEYIDIKPVKEIKIDQYRGYLTVGDYKDYSEDENLTKFREYLFKQSYLKGKKVVIPDEFSSSNIDELKSIYEGYDVLVYPEDSGVPMNMDDIENVSYFDKLCNDIKKLNLSQLEEILLCYDIVREREYNLGTDSDSFESRNIYKILNGDKIVCAGYSDIICRMFYKLNIPFINTTLRGAGGLGGHARVTVFVDDPEYKVKGIFGLDPTFDSNNEKIDYLSKYNHFLHDLDYFNKIDKRIGLIPSSFGLLEYCDLVDFPSCVDRIDGRQIGNFAGSWDVSPDDMVKNFRAYSTFVKIVYLLYGKEIKDKKELKSFVEEHIDEIKNNLKPSINTSTMVKLLLNVRAIENRIDSDKYPYDIDQCSKGAVCSSFEHDKDAIDKTSVTCAKSFIVPNYQRSEEDYLYDWREMVLSNYDRALARANELIKDPDAISLELYKKSEK